jgi:hypothetical protein
MWLPSPVDHRHQLLLQELKAFVVNATVLPSELGTLAPANGKIGTGNGISIAPIYLGKL